ncbi:hypothetical protein, partial [Synechococcus sp. R5-12]|uniref:hypothetical protein n=1 Tax=Synechococcus sp. R5-12 TaxID=2421321 RepID=UPI0039C75920
PPRTAKQSGSGSLLMQKLQDSLVKALSIDGALGVALGDWKTGMCLGYRGTNSPAFPEANLELAIAGNTEVIRAKMRVAESLKFTDRIEEILIILETQYHLMRMLKTINGLFFYLALDREKGNLALARIKLSQIESELTL